MNPKPAPFNFTNLVSRAIETGKLDDDERSNDRCRDLATEIARICDRMRDIDGLRPAEILYTLAKFSGTLINRLARDKPSLNEMLCIEVGTQILLHAEETSS